MMLRIGEILSRNLRRRQVRGLLTKFPSTLYDVVGVRAHNFPLLRAHPFPSFFCTSNFISQVEQPSIVNAVGECSSSDEEFSSSDGECTSSDREWDSEEEQFRGTYKGEWRLDEEWHWQPKMNLYNGLVVPLVQVYSISLHTNFDDVYGSSHIYGSIRTTNPRGVIRNLYMRDIGNHEIVPNGGSLSLIERLYKSISYGPTTNTTIDLNLSDKSRETVLINEKHNLHSLTEDFEDSAYKLIKKIIPGANCFAVVYYAKFLYAVPAIIKVAIFCKRDTTRPFVDVYGDIAVGYSNARQYCNNDDEVRHMKCTLFSKPFDKPERVMVGKSMRLSRYVVAIPAYSSIVIDADISDSHGRLACGSLEFQFDGQSKKFIDGEFGIIAVIVDLETPYREFIPEVNTRENDVGENDSDALAEDLPSVGVSSVLAHQKKNLVVSHQQNLPSSPSGTRHFSSMESTSRNNTVDDRVRFYGSMQAELFSVYVGGTDSEVSAICGNISLGYPCSFKWNIFASDLDTPELFPQGKGFFRIKGGFLVNYDFIVAIDLYLIDPISTKELCNKHINYHWTQVDRGDSVPPDKRLCSIFKLGSNGYVLLHYIIFDNACQATVDIKFFSDHPSSLPVKICGSVMASYSNHNYSTMYEKKYYRSRLFDKPQTEFVQLDSDLSLPLSKSVVVVPEGASLVIEVDLETLSSDNLKDIVLDAKELGINLSRTVCEEIVGKNYRVHISVEFKKVGFTNEAI